MTDALAWIAAIFADTADKMGRGEGFPIIFGTYMAMMLFERLAYVFEHRGRPWNERDARANVMNSIVVAIGEALVFGGLFIGAYMLVYEHLRLFTVPLVWWGWLLAFLLNDLAYYLDHRLAHRTGLFWAIHTDGLSLSARSGARDRSLCRESSSLSRALTLSPSKGERDAPSCQASTSSA